MTPGNSGASVLFHPNKINVPTASSLAIPWGYSDDGSSSFRQFFRGLCVALSVLVPAGVSALVLAPMVYSILCHTKARKDTEISLVDESLNQITIDLPDETIITRRLDENIINRRQRGTVAQRRAFSGITMELLQRQNDRTSEALISFFEHDHLFATVSAKEVNMLRNRDAEDADKLVRGIQTSIVKGVVPPVVEVEPITRVHVDGKSACEVAKEILRQVPPVVPGQEGKLFIFQGLSGTGKGTTVATLKQKMTNAVTWSNGNVFRVLTLLLVLQCEEEGATLTKDYITTERVQRLMNCVHFGHYRGKYDIKVSGLGIDALVSDIENTLLKEPRVSKHIPTVAEEVQGEVIVFASDAVAKLCKEGMNVLLEGRAETVNYLRSPFRFELVVEDPNVLGYRRCAQRVMAQALQALQGQSSVAPEHMDSALQAALADLALQYGVDPNPTKQAEPRKAQLSLSPA
jgi:cytidylate kinase